MKAYNTIGTNGVSARYFYTCVVFFIITCTTAQVFYSTKPDYLKLKHEADNVLTHYTASYPDTTIADFHNYFPRNYLGNVGMPSPDYILSYRSADLGFRLLPSFYYNDQFHESDVAYYRTKGPYASLTGVAGSKKLQIFKLFFTHTYKDKINIAVKFNRYTSQGFYLKQQTYTNNFFITSNFTRKNNRAGYYFYFMNNSNKNQENGGIAGDTLSEYSLLNGKNLLPVNLSAAFRENKEYKVLVNPWFKLNKTNDSSDIADHFLQVRTSFNFNIYKYKDAGLYNDRYYTIMYLDTAITNDSTRVMKLKNEISYAVKSARGNLGFSVGYRNELNSVWQKADSLFGNNLIISHLSFRKQFYSNDSLKKEKAELNSGINAQYVFEGANSGNYKIEGRSQFITHSKRPGVLFLNLQYESRNADYIYNTWYTNHFSWWANGFLPQQQFQTNLGYTFNNKLGVEFLFQNISNYLFFDNVALPRQYTRDLQNVSVSGHYTDVLFKHLGFLIRHTFQNTSNTSYISIPPGITTAKLFYTGNLYRNNLQLQIGTQLQYYQSFYGYAYMPASQVFYLQEKYITGEYPFVDLYMNARIRPVNVFIKIENVLQGYAGKNYSFVPGYYQPDRAFRFGINWMFFD